jgi:nitrite reductase/ring-hydroxylating ferredoxin subunit
MLSKQDNDLLCRVGAGTAMGELMRRYWIPAMYGWELEPDGQPQRVRLLGEDLLAWRDSNGTTAFTQEHCPHRGVSLYYGRNEECGLRCCYHGWKYDTTGQCIDMPNEPASSNFKTKVRILSYRTAEAGGLVWVYMGPDQDNPPALPQFEWCLLPQSQVRHSHKLVYECNWMQALEGELDSTHVYFLHSRLRQDLPGKYGLWIDDKAARFHVVPTEYGLLYGAERSEPEGTYWRTTQFIFPFHAMFPAINNGVLPMSIYVPIDDEHTLHMGVSWHPTRELTPNTPEGLLNAPLPGEPGVLGGIGPMMPEQTGRFFARWWPEVSPASDFNMDLEAKKTKSFTGIPGVRLQDSAVIWSMGRIMPRHREHLGTADASIIRGRRALIAAATALAEHGTPPPASQQPELYRVRPCETILTPKDDWQTALSDWHNLRTNDYPNVEYMLPRWNRGAPRGEGLGRPVQAQVESPRA